MRIFLLFFHLWLKFVSIPVFLSQTFFSVLLQLPRLPEDLASILHLNQRHPGCCPVSKPAMTAQDQIEVGRLRVSGHKVQCPSGTHFFSLRGTPMNVNLKSSSSKRRGAQHQKSNAKPLCRRVETANTPWLQRLVVM